MTWKEEIHLYVDYSCDLCGGDGLREVSFLDQKFRVLCSCISTEQYGDCETESESLPPESSAAQKEEAVRIKPKPEFRSYEIWSEGYSATGDGGRARFLGSMSARTFQNACLKLLRNDSDYDARRNTLWGCHLFDNEADARKHFG